MNISNNFENLFCSFLIPIAGRAPEIILKKKDPGFSHILVIIAHMYTFEFNITKFY